MPSLLRGLRLSKLFGRDGHHHASSRTGCSSWCAGAACRGVLFPGFRDIRGYQAMYRDFAAAIRDGRAPEMSLERAIDDQRLMDQIYASPELT